MENTAVETVGGAMNTLNSVIEKDFFIGIIIVFIILFLLLMAYFVYWQGKNNREALQTIKDSFAESQKILVEENKNLRDYNLELLKQVNAKKRKE